jgi:hypothetical protein
LLDDVLILWLRIGAPGRQNFDHAIRGTATPERAVALGITVKALRERIRQQLSKWDADLLPRAISAAERRRQKVPGWARAELRQELVRAKQLEPELQRLRDNNARLVRSLGFALTNIPEVRVRIPQVPARNPEVRARHVLSLLRAFPDLFLNPRQTASSIAYALYDETHRFLRDLLAASNPDTPQISEPAQELLRSQNSQRRK